MNHVYIMSALGGTVYKVGITVKPSSRLATIKTSCPLPIVHAVFFAVEDAEESEKYIHKLLDKQRLYGEWFLLNDALYSALFCALSDLQFECGCSKYCKESYITKVQYPQIRVAI